MSLFTFTAALYIGFIENDIAQIHTSRIILYQSRLILKIVVQQSEVIMHKV